MNESLDKALNFLTGKTNIDAALVEELEKLVNDHPYFSVAHLLLAKKLTNANDSRYLPQVQKTALYFPDPYLLHYQLLNHAHDEPLHYNEEQTKQEDEEVIIQESRHKSIIIDKEPLQDQAFTEMTIADNKEIAFEELIITNEDQHPMATEFSAGESITDNTPAKNKIETSNEEQSAVAEINDKVFTRNQELTTVVHGANLEETTSQINQPGSKEANDLTEIIDKIPKQVDTEHVSQPEEEMAALNRQTDETVDQFLDELETSESRRSLENGAEDALPIEDISSPPQPQTLTEAEERDPEESEDTEEADDHEEIDEHEKMFQNIKAMLDASAKEANADTKNAFLPIDPYYTIDYFASQGIKLDLKKDPPDKLGKQVKKFTQWLKHMKKLGPEDSMASEGISPEEAEAQRIADASNTAREVVTEAMALVLEKQGKKDKAVQLYRKLTFLNPDKSAYFASKIKNLNGT